MEESNSHMCSWCGKLDCIFRCSKCHVAYYCGRKCQVDHWKTEHKQQCVHMVSRSISQTQAQSQSSNISPNGHTNVDSVTTKLKIHQIEGSPTSVDKESQNCQQSQVSQPSTYIYIDDPFIEQKIEIQKMKTEGMMLQYLHILGMLDSINTISTNYINNNASDEYRLCLEQNEQLLRADHAEHIYFYFARTLKKYNFWSEFPLLQTRLFAKTMLLVENSTAANYDHDDTCWSARTWRKHIPPDFNDWFDSLLIKMHEPSYTNIINDSENYYYMENSMNKLEFKSNSYLQILVSNCCLLENVYKAGRMSENNFVNYHLFCLQYLINNSQHYDLYKQNVNQMECFFVALFKHDILNTKLSSKVIELLIKLLNKSFFLALYLISQKNIKPSLTAPIKCHFTLHCLLAVIHLFHKFNDVYAKAFVDLAYLFTKKFDTNVLDYDFQSDIVWNKWHDAKKLVEYCCKWVYYITNTKQDERIKQETRYTMKYFIRTFKTTSNLNEINSNVSDDINHVNYNDEMKKKIEFCYQCTHIANEKIFGIKSKQQRSGIFDNLLFDKPESECSKAVTLLENLASMKQCNWKLCQRKDIKLKLCKQCKSVYYCSRKCQKKDSIMSAHSSIPHKQRCRKLQCRDFSITLGMAIAK